LKDIFLTNGCGYNETKTFGWAGKENRAIKMSMKNCMDLKQKGRFLNFIIKSII